MARRSQFGPDLFTRHGGCPGRSLVSALASPLVSGEASAGAGPSGDCTGMSTRYGFTVRLIGIVARHSLTVAVITADARDSGEERDSAEAQSFVAEREWKDHGQDSDKGL